MSAQPPLPTSGNVFISVKDADKPAALEIAREFQRMGFELSATEGTARALEQAGLKTTKLYRLGEGRPTVLDLIKNGQIHFIINTPSGQRPRQDEVAIRSAAVAHRVATMTTLRGARASVLAIRALKEKGLRVRSLQEYHAQAGP